MFLWRCPSRLLVALIVVASGLGLGISAQSTANKAVGGDDPEFARLVKEWTLARQEKLRENWRRARAGEQPEKMAGLDAD